MNVAIAEVLAMAILSKPIFCAFRIDNHHILCYHCTVLDSLCVPPRRTGCQSDNRVTLVDSLLTLTASFAGRSMPLYRGYSARRSLS